MGMVGVPWKMPKNETVITYMHVFVAADITFELAGMRSTGFGRWGN